MTDDMKYKKLTDLLRSMGRVVLAFSGGVDSTFLLMAAKETLGDDVKAVTFKSPYVPDWETEEAIDFASKLGVEHEVIEMPLIDEIRSNPPDRCYLCKKAIFTAITALAKNQGYETVIDGTNLDDLDDYRPGLRALKELNVRSPLMECGITKQEVRDFSKEAGLGTWDKPAYACLLTRIPYGTLLREEDIIKIRNSEKFMMDMGFGGFRVRSHGDLARIELERKDLDRFLEEPVLKKITNALKQYGFQYVTLDLATRSQ